MRRLLIPVLFSVCAAAYVQELAAQETIAPTTGERVGSARGENVGAYNVVQSWEFGYRYATVGGDDGKYRSDVNYGRGVRLLSSSLTVNSKDGHGKWFDEIVLTTQGLGNDPYESAILRVQKNRIYRYDMTWRLNDYYNPGLTTALGLHLQNTSQRWQDHELTLFPQSKFRIHAGYGHNKEDGPALSTVNLFENERGDIFTLFSNVRREYNSYRIGVDGEWMGIRMSVLRRWEFYKEDTPYSLGGPGAGLNPTDATTLTQYYRSSPIHGDTPSWLGIISSERRLVAFNGRISYAGGTRNFVQNESPAGTGLGGAESYVVLTYGNAKRPTLVGDFNVAVFPAGRWTITNNTSVSNQRIVGDSTYEQFSLSTLNVTLLNFQFLGVRLITNSTDVRFRATKKLSVFAGYRYSNREIRSIQSSSDPTTPFENTLNSQVNMIHAGAFGLNWTIAQPLRLHVAAEVGHSDNPFTSIDPANYHTIDARLQYRKKALSGAAGYKQNYNNNSMTLTSYSSHSRNYFANGSWAANSWFSIDAGYNRLHLDTAGGLLFFGGLPRSTQQTGTSVYLSNIHAGNLGARVAIRGRADVYVGYNITRDAGDGRGSLQTPGTVSALLYNVQTFPLSFESPMARLSIRVTDKIKWNAGYQYYGYHQDFAVNSVLQNYHAHTGYTSLLWAF